MSGAVGRRQVVQGIAATGILAFVPRDRLLAAAASGVAPGAHGRFLSAAEMNTLRAVTDRLLPGPPEDPDPGALDAHCAEAIDALLGAFTFDPPLIHAGGPFSNRAGAEHDDMASFVPLDPVAELGWRIRLEGTQGRADRAFAAPVKGLQQDYRLGLAALDRLAGTPAAFATASTRVQDRILADPRVVDFTNAVVSDCINAMYGAPEYLGNRNLSGWTPIGWSGDVQPRGWTDHQVSSVDPHPRRPVTAAQGRAALTHFVPGVEDVR